MDDNLNRECDTDDCGRTRGVTWSHTFGAHLCVDCLWRRTERELRPTTGLPPGFYRLEPL